MSEPVAMDYRTQITGWLPNEAGQIPYWIQHEPVTGLPVEYEGHTVRSGSREVMLMSYETDLHKIGTRKILAQTLWQIEALPDGSTLEIHCATAQIAQALKRLFDQEGIREATVVFTPRVGQG